MRINCGPSSIAAHFVRRVAAEAEVERLKRWQPCFAWPPKRVGENDCRWLEAVERRYPGAFVYGDTACKQSSSVKYRARSQAGA